MNPNQETFETWNKVAQQYQDKFMGMDLYNDSYELFTNSIPKSNSKLLEIGCGPGNISRYLLSKRPDYEIFGIDIAPKMIELAKQNNPTANFEVMDTREIKNLTTKYDGIINGFCLPYLSTKESEEFISNSYDLLNEQGVLYVSFVEGNPENSGFKVSNVGRVYFHYHLLNEIKSQLSNHHFEEIKTIKVNYKTSETEFDVHTILIAKKMN